MDLLGSSAARCTGLVLAALLPGRAPWSDTLLVPDGFGTIRAALEAAEPGDSVVVAPGIYVGNLDLPSGVEVRGVETARTLIEPDDESAAAVAISGADGARLSNVTLIGSSVGVSIAASVGVEVVNVVFDRVAEVGLTADSFSSVEVANGVFFRNDTAVSRGSVAVALDSNIFQGNRIVLETAAALGRDPFSNVRSNCFWRNDGATGAGLGATPTVGDAMFVDTANRDFHLREGSACIDAGRGTDAIDDTVGDAGAYGGPFADPFPYPVGAPALVDASTADPPVLNVDVSWEPNLDYRVTNSVVPGSYAVYYKRGGDPARPFDGTDAGGGTLPSPIDAGTATSFVLEDLTAETSSPLAPRLVSASGRDTSAILTWEPVPNATSYRVRYGVSAVTENAVDAGDVTRFIVTGLVNGTTYRFAVVAVNEPVYHVAVTARDNTQDRNESAIVDVASITLGGAGSQSPPSGELTATVGPITPHPDLPDEGCFVATAAFGAEWGTQVTVLRDFRDRVLSTRAAGRRLVRAYYAHGPRAAALLRDHETLKPLARAALWPVVVGALLCLEAAPALAMAAVVLALLALRRLRPRRRGICCAALALLVSAAAVAREPASTFSPRWTYELKGGYVYPELDDYEDFYGEDRDTSIALAGGYRVRDWLEAGLEIGYSSAGGAGITAEGELAQAVRLRLLPVHVFANFVHQPDLERRWVPYAGVGVAVTWYEQGIEQQGEREGRSDPGPVVRIGMRWLFRSSRPPTAEARAADVMYERSYLLIEAQSVDAEIGSIDLGGRALRIGYRAEFELGR